MRTWTVKEFDDRKAEIKASCCTMRKARYISLLISGPPTERRCFLWQLWLTIFLNFSINRTRLGAMRRLCGSHAGENMAKVLVGIIQEFELTGPCKFEDQPTIDGLDEFDGDFSASIALLEELARHPKNKLLIPSRPVQEAFEASKEGSQLRLQDLMKSDIAQHIPKWPNMSTSFSLNETFPEHFVKWFLIWKGKLVGSGFVWYWPCRSLLDELTKRLVWRICSTELSNYPPSSTTLHTHSRANCPPLPR